MRSFFFAAKIALIFVLLLGLSLGGTLWLFMRVAAPPLAADLGRLRASEATRIAEALEATLDSPASHPAAPFSPPLEAPEFRALMEDIARSHELHLSAGEELEPPPPEREWRYRFHPQNFQFRGREIHQLGPPAFDLWLPLFQNGEKIGHLRVRGPTHGARIHMIFEHGLSRIAGLTLISILLVSVFLTLPLRRMKRSMDRIAAGELDHRVNVRGRDEVAAVGRSFNSMADRIEQMILGQKEMLAGISHELRSPLGRMKMMLELMREKDRPSTPRLDALEEEIDHLDDLIEEILTTSRLDLGTAPLRLESIDLRSALEEAWGTIQPAPRSGSPELIIEVTDSPQVQADSRLLGRLLGNLLLNARRYAEKEIRVRAGATGGRVEIEIADDGPGVDEGELARLFEPFYRADPARGHGGHVGMGLAIVRKAVIAHGGQVTARISDLGGLAISFDLATGEMESGPSSIDG